jgi:hypothetical protein
MSVEVFPPPYLSFPRHRKAFPTASFTEAYPTASPANGSMSIMYQPAPAAYDSHGLHAYHVSSRGSSADRTVEPIHDPRQNQTARYSMQQQKHIQQQQQQQQQAQAFQPAMTSRTHYLSSSNHTNPTVQPPSKASAAAQSTPESTRSADTLVYHSLQIPKCISANGGNLAEFAAQMTCLFWFQTGDSLKQAESIRTRRPNAPITRLPSLSIPQEQFRKWVLQVLSITQVTQNVILLALMFIYRLKMSTPQIKGRGGSEYRLLTVALMLGNKFLDDNTYTNKTWAEVSCFSVQEIHVMEVEFLSNMRYNLLASKEEWDSWLVKLACFHEYYERALRAPTSPLHVPSPATHHFSSPVSSPTGAPRPSMPDVSTPNFHSAHAWPMYPHPHPTDAISPLATKPAISLPTASRKRTSPGEDVLEHPAKRVAPPRLEAPVGSVPNMVARGNVPNRLPVPQLTLVTNPGVTSVPATATNAASNVSLPPLQPGVRAMSTVYQQTQPAMVQQPTMPAPSAPPTLTPTSFQGAPLPGHHHFSTPNKHPNPAGLMPYTSSPMVEPFGNHSGLHTPVSLTPIANSPIAYLQQRQSPYRPIRHVNTLLYPPPSASLDQYHLSVPVQPTQMHYQPLGRRNDVRTGVVPDFVMFNRGQQQGVLQGTPQGHYAS